jgi:hypothetical protein
MGKSTISMAIFNSYVSLPEGIWINVVKTINHPILDDIYHPFIVILGMVYECFNHIYIEANEAFLMLPTCGDIKSTTWMISG